MANWRKQQGESHHQVGQWRSSYNRKPPLGDKWHSTVPAWERKFCTSIGSVPWRKLVESKKYMHLFEHVVNWDDSAGKEAFDNAKMRYWAEINGVPCNISLPDPNIYTDEVDWNAIVDPQLILDMEMELAKVPNEELRNDHEIVMIGGALFLNEQQLPCTGWDDDYAAEAPNPNSAVQGWAANLQANNGVESGQQNHAPAEHVEEHFAPAEPAKEDFAPAEHAKGYEWQDWRNDSWGWNQRENNGGGGDLHKMGRGRNGRGYGNWGTWDGYNRRRENMSWSKTPTNGNNEYHVNNRGRRNYREGGGRTGKPRRAKRPKEPKSASPNKKTSKPAKKVKKESEDLNKVMFGKSHEWKSGQEMVNGGDDLNKQLTVSKADWKGQDLGLNQVAYDESTMPAPVCSCTGVLRQCYKWGNGGWQSACCTTTLSMYPLPAVPNKRHARVGGRKMSGSAFNKLLSRLAAEGHDLSNPVDLKDHWAKHGTNRYITIK